MECNRVITLVIDDGSTDSTCSMAMRGEAEFVYQHSQKLGVGQAVKTGLKYALQLGTDVIVNMDADNQFNSTEILALVAPIVNGMADVILGSRFLGHGCHVIPTIKRVGNTVVSRIVSLASDQSLCDTQCGFRALEESSAVTQTFGYFHLYTRDDTRFVL